MSSLLRISARCCRLASPFLAVAVMLGIAASAGAGPLYRWTTKDGVLSYADNLHRIPKRYRSQARQVPERALSGYAHLTPTDPKATRAYEKELTEHVEHLRELNASLSQTPATAGGAVVPEIGAITVEAGNLRARENVEFQTARGNAPIYVQRERVLDTNGTTTRHVTVIRQGGRVIAVIDETAQSLEGPTYRGTVRSLLESN